MRVMSFTLPDGSQTAWGVEAGGRVTSCVSLAPTLEEFLRRDGHSAEDLRRIAESGTATEYALSDVRVEAPLRPRKVVAIGQNYRDHCAEQGVEPPDRPIIFAKFPTSVIGPWEPILWDPDLTA